MEWSFRWEEIRLKFAIRQRAPTNTCRKSKKSTSTPIHNRKMTKISTKRIKMATNSPLARIEHSPSTETFKLLSWGSYEFSYIYFGNI